MLKDRGDQFKYALVSALYRAAKIARGLRVGLTISERETLADAAIGELRRTPDDPWRLPEPLPHDWGVMSDLGAPPPPDWCGPKSDPPTT